MGFTQEKLQAIRRSLHQIPEIGLEEVQTQAFLLAEIAKMPQTFLTVKTWQTAIIVHVSGSQPTKTIGWRSDIDALPILEATGLPFASQTSGKMHACGHDFHMTIALGVLAYFSEHQPQENLTILFQPAEENEAGGMLVYESGALDEWLPDEFYALHVNPDLPVGTIGTRPGTLFAGTCEIQAHFTGKSGHAAYPHQAQDMIVAASAFVQQVQTIVSRNVNPVEGAVVTIGTFQAGSATNVIAGEAHLSGTIRTLTQEMNQLTQARIREIAAGIAQAFGCQVDLVLDQKGYLPVENNHELTQNFMAQMKKNPAITFQEVGSAMTGEDFGYLLAKVPGTMFWLGVDSPYGLHHEAFNPNEAALTIGVDAVISFLRERTKA